MDLYTTSFTFPRPTPRGLRSTTSPLPNTVNLPGSASLTTIPLPNVTSATTPPQKPSSRANVTTAAEIRERYVQVQRLVNEVTQREACLVTVTKEQNNMELGAPTPTFAGGSDVLIPDTTVWNYHLSGSYPSVILARGGVLRETPRDNGISLKVARTLILESPLAHVSPLKPDVNKRIEGAAIESRAKISIMNLTSPGSGGVGGTLLATADEEGLRETSQLEFPSGTLSTTTTKRESAASSSAGTGEVTTDPSPTKASKADSRDSQTSAPPTRATVTFGLETERLCEIVISGSLESVEVAKMRMLVMLDELSGLHAEACDIDYKLHPIIASRRRCVIQSIQEETATNIYYPTPLVGVLNAPEPGAQQGVGYRHLSVNGLSAQPTGMTAQVTGNSYGVNYGGMNNAVMAGQFGAPMIMGMGGYHHPPSIHHQQHPHRNHHQPAIYNPHQHVHYPYQPQPLNVDPQASRGMPYNGPAASHFSPINHLHPSTLVTGPMYTNRNAMSPMHTGSRSGRQMRSPIPIGPHQGMQSPVSFGGMGMGPTNGFNMGHGPGPGGMPGIGMVNNLNMPFLPPQTHMPVGVSGGPMGMNQGVHGGMVGPGMGSSDGNMSSFGLGPHPGLSVHSGEQGVLGKANQIWITGEFFGVQRARDMLLNVAFQKSKLVISRDTALLPRKLDWLLTERLEEVKNIMADNGTYIQAPCVGSQASLLTIFGDHRVNIERTIRSIMSLACQFYVASIWLLPISFDVLMPQASLNPAQMQPILKKISHTTSAEIVFKSNCFEMHGLEHEVQNAIKMILDLEMIHSFQHEIRFQIELANEHRDFIAGKKNGKLNKIMKLAGVKIKFETFNDYNFLIDISGSNLGALQGLTLLHEELPAEVSFHVPETYHKRIIGVGGKNIQRIMKQFGVYVKFSNAEEFAAIGGYTDNEDNVVARTPAKNAESLEALKQSIMEMVNPKDRDYTMETVSAPRRYHRTLLGEKSIFIHDIESKTNSLVRFPYKETASDQVTIFGPESQVHIAAAMLLDHVPFEADLHVPPNPELTRLATSTEFILFAERVKRDHQIAISHSAKFGQGDEAIFKFRCQRSNIDFLGTARDSLEEFLKLHEIQVYPSNAHKRTESFTDTFSHFNSKLLSTSNNTQDGEGEASGERRRRPSSVSTNVKALFDGTATGGAFRVPDDPTLLGFAGPLSYHDPRRLPDLWPTVGSTQTSSDAETSKRESDPILQEKVRQAATGMNVPGPPHGNGHGGSRGVSARTQSLDISTLNFPRGLSGSASNLGSISPSPNTMGASPNTATGQYFPGGHLRPSVTGREGSSYDGSVTALAAGISNVSISHR